jgi:putative hydroxymethylpyrimidine transport system substrate-binding protein
VRVRLDWTPWAPHAALYAAREKGFFREEGLNVNLYVPPDPEATIQFVAAGKDDFGISYMTDTILAREQGFNVISVAALVAHPLNCIMTLRTSGIDSIAKLGGKVIGTTGVPSDDAFLEWVTSAAGLPKGRTKLVNLGFNLAPALKSGKVDAIIGAYWPWEGLKLDEEGYPVNVLKLQDYGVPDYYELVLIARSDRVVKDPKLIRGFLRALVEGQTFVDNNSEAAVQILATASPDLKPEFLKKSLRAILPLTKFDGGPFHQDERTWSQMMAFMQRAGLLTKPPELSSVFSNDYLK